MRRLGYCAFPAVFEERKKTVVIHKYRRQPREERGGDLYIGAGRKRALYKEGKKGGRDRSHLHCRGGGDREKKKGRGEGFCRPPGCARIAAGADGRVWEEGKRKNEGG